MAEGKFAGLRTIRQQAAATENEPAADTALVTAAQQPAKRGRPAGKRSDPEWKLYSHFLKKRTQREVTTILRATDDRRDLSDLLQELLEQWISNRQ